MSRPGRRITPVVDLWHTKLTVGPGGWAITEDLSALPVGFAVLARGPKTAESERLAAASAP